jgi:predicted DNA binding CopG/RHH family protein
MRKRANKEKASTTKKNRIPEFKSREEEAEFWDTHDTTDYEGEFKPVRVRFARNLSHPIPVRLDAKTWEKLKLRAQKKGLGATTLARMWIIERLEQPEAK